MNPTERDSYLRAVDLVLNPLGFKRSKSSFEWKRKVDSQNSEWIHLNFGKAVINPSLGVFYADLEKLLPPEAGAVTGVSRMLSTIASQSYSTQTRPEQIAEDIVRFALPALVQLRDRVAIAAVLQNSLASDWPTFSASHRMRLLPLLLAGMGRVSEALDWLTHLEKVASSSDQMLPKFEAFASHFRGKYIVKQDH